MTTLRSIGRRNFLSSLAFTPLGGMTLHAIAERAEPDETWLRELRGKHRQFFDVGSVNEGNPLRRVHNFLRTYATAYNLDERHVNAVFGAHGNAIPLVLGDDAWRRHGLGRRYNIIDPGTRETARRNPYLNLTEAAGALPAEASVRQLQRRGVRFLACNNTLTNLSQELAREGNRPPDDVYQELRAGLVDAVVLVPAMLIAGNRAQESGVTYAALG